MKTTHKEILLASLKKFDTCEVVVNGTSMWPFIKNGDTISIKQKPFKPSIGKVIAFFTGDQLITHRIVWYRKKDDDMWEVWVHGDSCPRSISKINSNQIIGVIESVKRDGRVITSPFTGIYRLFTIPIGFLLQLLIIIKSGKNKYLVTWF